MTDNLFAQRTIPQNLVAVSFEPTNKEDNPNGEMTFGGTDSSRFTGSIAFTYVVLHLEGLVRCADSEFNLERALDAHICGIVEYPR